MSDDITLPTRPAPEAPADTVGLPWDAYTGWQMLTYGRACADAAVEADRADHFRGVTKMMPSDELRGMADTAYSRYIQQMRAPECLGWEQKVKTGKFGEAELKAHTKAGEFLGRHRAFSECADMLSRYGSSRPAYGHSGQPAASAEVDAWRERFPAYEYRPQDECVALKLSAPAASAEPCEGSCRLENGGQRCSDCGYVARFPLVEPMPVAPVAQEPVGLLDAIDGLMDFAPSCAAGGPGMVRGGDYIKKSEVLRVIKSCAAPVAQEPVLVGWTVGVDGGGILHAAKYTEDEAKRAGYPLAVYRLVRPKSALVAAQEQPPSNDMEVRNDADRAAAHIIARLFEIIPLKDALRATSSGAAMVEYFRKALAAQPCAQDREDAQGVAPWDDCKVAYGVGCEEALWAAWESGMLQLPLGWSLNETDGTGARMVAVFRVDGVPTQRDGATVRDRLSAIDTARAAKGE